MPFFLGSNLPSSAAQAQPWPIQACVVRIVLWEGPCGIATYGFDHELARDDRPAGCEQGPQSFRVSALAHADYEHCLGTVEVQPICGYDVHDCRFDPKTKRSNAKCSLAQNDSDHTSLNWPRLSLCSSLGMFSSSTRFPNASHTLPVARDRAMYCSANEDRGGVHFWGFFR